MDTPRLMTGGVLFELTKKNEPLSLGPLAGDRSGQVRVSANVDVIIRVRDSDDTVQEILCLIGQEIIIIVAAGAFVEVEWIPDIKDTKPTKKFKAYVSFVRVFN